MSSKSEFIFFMPFEPSSPDDGGTSHTCAMEFVPNIKRPREVYILFDGQRIAKREWVPLVDGYDVVTEGPHVIAVFVGGKRCSFAF